MHTKHYEFWPKLTKSLTIPETSIYENLQVSARRYPKHAAISYYGTTIPYEKLLGEVDALAGYMQKEWEVKKGDKILLLMQNAPQYIVSFFAILRTGAVVVPINPMLKAEELAFYVKDGAIEHAIAGQELMSVVEPLLTSTTLHSILSAAYSDYRGKKDEELQPQEVTAEKRVFESEAITLWSDALEREHTPIDVDVRAEDLAVMPYTSGTTGLPKGCMHTHRTVQANTLGAFYWSRTTMDSKSLATLPFFHVTGMVHSMLMPVYSGNTAVVMTRWNREMARRTIRDEACTHWVTISTMLVDFLANPEVKAEDLTTLYAISGGGASFPKALGEKLYKLTGLEFVEGYGLSETIAQTHFNPPDRPKMQCLGIPSFNVDARIIDPATLEEVGTGEVGEIVVNGPQIMVGYYNRPEENEHAFLDMDGKSFFRTGDIGRMDEEGYYFIVDRLKRMINASGYNVWPTEVESALYDHPAVQQACVVGVPDPRKGENIKAFVILNESYEGDITEEEIIAWSKERMAAYKYPRMIEFIQELPMTNSGKILWRKLQEDERKKVEANQES
ncbi:long-chain-fatty-acid--CoA ligase [Halobacillus sp. ACCC02827]|uniref:long-chain-fatty-acid--CoA ligase n=1 Tax=Bacillaceae TaxID=186817 RepID=UPI000411B3BC|nr:MULTISPECIES: long-chain-fatty-acid--CoA ligase [Bacillaceae]QHT47748.1 AMP-binding protein [Bacillus sp. SB49]WJE14988.1 long-chain-fatty-acid--CoA ligase [Halobacillus sp. ACCC02827]